MILHHKGQRQGWEVSIDKLHHSVIKNENLSLKTLLNLKKAIYYITTSDLTRH